MTEWGVEAAARIKKVMEREGLTIRDTEKAIYQYAKYKRDQEAMRSEFEKKEATLEGDTTRGKK
jgi:hypothetical protein